MTTVDIEHLFGTNAGKVYKALEKKGNQSATHLIEETKLKISEIHAALGWLAREGKIRAERTKSGTTYSLN